ncbi:MAG: hypothetical protein FDX18_10610 [Chlorobium sp.]|nr:MAG: hypothetical protein FDX18_10610 [Chlorobium sp.]
MVTFTIALIRDPDLCGWSQHSSNQSIKSGVPDIRCSDFQEDYCVHNSKTGIVVPEVGIVMERSTLRRAILKRAARSGIIKAGELKKACPWLKKLRTTHISDQETGTPQDAAINQGRRQKVGYRIQQ